ncbi:MAG: acyltransferase [Clostridiales bacterium]|nr:acyltransferase [Clostridiales bacterium]
MKAILIFLVVLGHVLSNMGIRGDHYVLYQVIFTFHMPVFLFVSGYFMKYNPKRLFARLFPLYVLFQTIQTVERLIIVWLQGDRWQDVRIDLFTPRWTLWYLVVLMAYQLLIPLFDTESKKRQLGFLILSACLGLSIGITDDTDNFLAMSRAFSFLPFFLLGFYERKNHLLIRNGRDRFPKIARFTSAVAGGIMILAFYRNTRRIDSKDFMGTEDYADVNAFLMRILGWCMALLWIMILLIWVPQRRLPVCSRLGRNTMSIYLLHAVILIVLRETPLKPAIQNSIPSLVLLSVGLTILLSWEGCGRMLGKIKIHMK